MHPISSSSGWRETDASAPPAQPPVSRGSGQHHPGRSSGLWIILLTAPSHSDASEQWHPAAVVPTHSGGTATAFTVFPIEPFKGTRIIMGDRLDKKKSIVKRNQKRGRSLESRTSLSTNSHEKGFFYSKSTMPNQEGNNLPSLSNSTLNPRGCSVLSKSMP